MLDPYIRSTLKHNGQASAMTAALCSDDCRTCSATGWQCWLVAGPAGRKPVTPITASWHAACLGQCLKAVSSGMLQDACLVQLTTCLAYCSR